MLSQDKLNVHSVGFLSTWYTECHNSKKISGKLSFKNNYLSDLNFTVGSADEKSLIWVIYLHEESSKLTNLIKQSVVPSISSNQIGLSLVKITRLEDKAIYFDGFDDRTIEKNTIIDIIPYISEYHSDRNFKGSCPDTDVKDLQFSSHQAHIETESCEPPILDEKENLSLPSDLSFENIDLKGNFAVNVDPKEEYFNDFDDAALPASFSPSRSNSDDDDKECLQAKEESLQNLTSMKKECENETVNLSNIEIDSTTESTKKYKYFRKVSEQKINGIIKRYQCLSCNKYFATKTSVNLHVKLHTGEKLFKCAECDKTFTTRDNMRHHLRKHTGEKRHTCPLCKKKFFQANSLHFHLRSHHAGEEILECDICNKLFIFLEDYDRHKKTHSVPENFKSVDDQSPHHVITADPEAVSIKTEDRLSNARRTRNKRYKYSSRSKKRNIKKSLKSDIKNVNQKSYTCDYCLKTFQRKMDLRKHISEHMKLSKVYVCYICKKSFKDSEDLTIHSLVHANDFKCEICNKAFHSKSVLTKHMISHSDIKPFQCCYCGRTFKIKESLERHTRTHTGEKPYACSLCDFTSADRSNLVVHTRIHTGDKPYCCSVCGRAFINSTHIKVHMRTHTGEKPYSCYCGKSYSHLSVLRRHELSHTGQKPHTCPLCDSMYVKRETLKKHVKRVHPGSEHLIIKKKK